ncbi:MAG: DUF4010 domain-containing protein [Candidatus Gracilibacteria bacterium]|nr:DUF4010 domain-containing protein [Candidatus Gracilibacteria bacterium]
MDFSFWSQSPVFQLLLTIALGAILGIRREMDGQTTRQHQSFIGVRTTMCLAVLGLVSTFFPSMPFLPPVIFGSVVVLMAIAYWYGNFRLKKPGMTSELSGLLTFWLGALVGFGQPIIALLLTIFLFTLKEFRDDLHRFVRTLTPAETRGALQFLVFSGAVLPFLPQEPIDPWGIFVPFTVWLLVMLISGIGFVGYFLTKYFGARGGIPLVGLLGALVSSTAVTVNFSEQSRKKFPTNILAAGILIAMAVMEWRVLLEIFLLSRGQFGLLFLAIPALMGAISMGIGWTMLRQKGEAKSPKKPPLKSPFELRPALKFGLIFIVVLFAISFGQKYLGTQGVYAAAFLSGLVDVDAVVLSSLESFRLGELSLPVTRTAIFIALMVNTLTKLGYVALLGSRELFRKIIPGVAIVSAAGGLVFLFL